MKYAMCPKCGRKLCKGETGTRIEVECPKCRRVFFVHIDENDVHIKVNR